MKYDGNSFANAQFSLPNDNSQHCFAKANQETAFHTGGKNGGSDHADAYAFDILTETFTPIDSMVIQ